uniref:(northern house mosquito) hypothetical protein n=1 Tax=Culex pipiens TaxID=7175 RepID=A0A8D8J7R3_CULPI
MCTDAVARVAPATRVSRGPSSRTSRAATRGTLSVRSSSPAVPFRTICASCGKRTRQRRRSRARRSTPVVDSAAKGSNLTSRKRRPLMSARRCRRPHLGCRTRMTTKIWSRTLISTLRVCLRRRGS